MIRFLIGVLALLAALPAEAGKVYKWTDKNGKVHYSDSPVGAPKLDIEVSRGPVPGLFFHFQEYDNETIWKMMQRGEDWNTIYPAAALPEKCMGDQLAGDADVHEKLKGSKDCLNRLEAARNYEQRKADRMISFQKWLDAQEARNQREIDRLRRERDQAPLDVQRFEEEIRNKR